MSDETRRTYRLHDLRAVILECKKCHAIIGYPPDNWKILALKCPNNCTESEIRDDRNEHAALESFRTAVGQLLQSKLPFEVRLEFNGPPAKAEK